MRPKFTKIVCAVDASEHSEAVLAAAVEMAHCHGARLVVATVLESIQTFMHARMEEYLHDDQRQQLQREGRARLEKALHEQIVAATGDTADAAVAIAFLEGRPATAILEYAAEQQASLVVLGSHGHSAIGELLIGSTAREVTQRATVPVLLVPIGR